MINIDDTIQLADADGGWVNAIVGGTHFDKPHALIAGGTKLRVLGESPDFGFLCEVVEIPSNAGGTVAKVGTRAFVCSRILNGTTRKLLNQHVNKYRMELEYTRIAGA